MVYASIEHPFFIQCADKFKVELHRQIEGDLGRRMAYAFDKTLERAPMLSSLARIVLPSHPMI